MNPWSFLSDAGVVGYIHGTMDMPAILVFTAPLSEPLPSSWTVFRCIVYPQRPTRRTTLASHPYNHNPAAVLLRTRSFFHPWLLFEITRSTSIGFFAQTQIVSIHARARDIHMSLPDAANHKTFRPLTTASISVYCIYTLQHGQ